MRILFVEAHAEGEPLINPPKIIAKILSKKGHSVTFLSGEARRSKGRLKDAISCLRPSCRTIEDIEYCDSPYFKFPFGVEQLSSLFFTTLFALLYFRSRKFDVIFVGDCGFFALSATIIARAHKCPVIADFDDPYWWHLKDPFPGDVPYMLEEIFVRHNLNNSKIQQVFANDQPIVDYIQEAHYGKTLHICPVGYFEEDILKPDAREILRLKQDLGLSGYKVVLYAGSMASRLFRSDVLIRSAELLTQRRPDLCFAITGRIYGAEIRKVIGHVLSRNPRIRYYGWLPIDRYRALLHVSDVCVSVRDSDLTGSKVVEYLNWGKALVSADAGSGQTRGLLVSGYNSIRTPLDPMALSEAIVELLENPEKARELAQNGRKTFSPYTWERIAAMHIEAAEFERAGLARP